MSKAHDERLVERARAGDMHAWEQLISQYEKLVYNLAYRFTGNREDAWDMYQEAFTRVYLRLNDFRGDSSFETWLRAVVANACRDELRKRKRQATTSLDEPVLMEDGDVGRQIADPGEQPQEALERQESARMVQQAMQTLDADYRLVLVLRDFQDQSYEEIAANLHMPLGTVKSRLSRARLALKDALVAMELFGGTNVYRGKRARGKLREVP